MDESSSTRWLINTFAVKNVLDLGKERLSGRVSVEEAPSGEKNLLPLMKAMEEMMEVEIEYQKYKSTSSELLHVQPFALKQDKQRWYLAGYCEERAISKEGNRSPNSDIRAWRVYSLDRIMSVKQTEVKFSLPGGFDVDDCFAQSYGPYLPNDGSKAVTIRFRASDSEAKYLRDLPLHKSQKEESRKKDSEHIFSIRVIPNTDLIMEFCKRGSRVEVLEPAEVREKVAEEIKNANEIYCKKR
jgi:predicted DNA-binding transcriptional regulator YafY